MKAETNTLLVNDENEVISLLRSINWSFYKRLTIDTNEVLPFNCRRHHWYPATFIPEIPFTLIEILSKPGAVVYDPFGGIGTTYFQALLLERVPFTTEICNAAFSYIKCLFSLFDPSIDHIENKKKINQLLKLYDSETNYVNQLPEDIDVSNIRPWYSEKTLNMLCYLFLLEMNINNNKLQSLFRICLSNTIMTVNSQKRGWGYVADNVIPKDNQIKDKNAISFFRNSIKTLTEDLVKQQTFYSLNYKDFYDKVDRMNTILNENAKSCTSIQDESVDVIITSPPYPNMVDYVNSQRLVYYFLGNDIKDDLTNEIGARNRRNRKDSLDEYFSEMKEVNRSILKKVKRGGYACFVMPWYNDENEKNIERKKVIEKLINNITDNNFVQIADLERIIPSKKRSHNSKWASLEEEKIYLFKKE